MFAVSAMQNDQRIPTTGLGGWMVLNAKTVGSIRRRSTKNRCLPMKMFVVSAGRLDLRIGRQQVGSASGQRANAESAINDKLIVNPSSGGQGLVEIFPLSNIKNGLRKDMPMSVGIMARRDPKIRSKRARSS